MQVIQYIQLLFVILDMKKAFVILILAIISIVGCKKYDFGEIPDWHYLIVSNTYMGSWETRTYIRYDCDYETRDGLDVEPLEYCDWLADFKVDYGKIYVSVDENNTGSNRKCLLVAYNDKYNIADTFEVEQGKKYEPSGGGSSSGGSSVSSGRCAARTKKGTRCKRRANKGSIYCWQHGG